MRKRNIVKDRRRRQATAAATLGIDPQARFRRRSLALLLDLVPSIIDIEPLASP